MIILILFLALTLRLINLNQSLWLDEAINVLACRDLSLNELLTKYILGDFHPPLFHLILYFWIKIFGDSETSVRIPSVLFGVGTVYLVYIITKKLVKITNYQLPITNYLPLLAALLMAIAPYHVYYSQEARPYSLVTFLTATSMYFFLKIVSGETGFKNWLNYIFITTLGLYSNYFALFILPAQFLALLTIKARSKPWKRLIFSWLVVFLFYLPWLPTFYKQLLFGRETATALPVWSKIVGRASLKNLFLTPIKFSLGRISFLNKKLYGAVALAVLSFYGYLILKAGERRGRESAVFLLSWLLVPIVLGFLISFKIPIYAPFRILLTLPAFYLLLALGVSLLEGRSFKLSLGAVNLVNICFLSLYFFNPSFHRDDWRRAVAFIHENNRAKNPVLIIYEVKKPYEYYDKGKSFLINYQEEKKVIFAYDTLWMVRFAWPIFDPQDSTRKNVEKEGFRRVFERHFNRVTIERYVKGFKKNSERHTGSGGR